MDNMRSDAYNEIKYKIIHFDYIPGQKISEKLISEQLGLGRTPVREAIIRIEREGLIEVIPQSGTYITKIDMADAKDGRFVRECIEPKIMINAAVNISDESLDTLKANLHSQAQTADKIQPDNFFDLDQDFHHEFYKVVNKETVWQWLQINNTQLNRFRRLRLKEMELNWSTIYNQHKKIFDAVVDKDIDDLEYLVNEHLHLMLIESKKVLDAYSDYFQNYEQD
ncbi:MAG: GntR family transcriptional regulator [Lentilactobacillus diolivorans]|jgi:DNA-binding GntR family transcriptional regulator|uniref:Transcriptional regulator, GntR family n=2 Tax=Lentilactobacillus diolivorans TaxID=179838 RepID=A0A0R1S890_9LACO|nr:GntR family transcriptional regulator [Lentilactobacillus diolivorans]KRL65127.1 transcriptional regulator, GntR family [Lentilactobacillus diolivorans DSM 14421]MCH4164939.1 GntR family transcriptional regulator [Lentilactobacillus diolivorans]RRG02731.1 MAG: GntR family transcriptional regulator [Lactobacillus sp.]GEP24933.1 GntR family transcriptional regulator [Lentilactobacillus diolivorans]